MRAVGQGLQTTIITRQHLSDRVSGDFAPLCSLAEASCMAAFEGPRQVADQAWPSPFSGAGLPAWIRLKISSRCTCTSFGASIPMRTCMPFHAKDSDLDVVMNDDAFAYLAGEYQHERLLDSFA